MKKSLLLILWIALISCENDSVNIEVEKEDAIGFPFIGTISSVTGSPLALVDVNLYLVNGDPHATALKTNGSGVFVDSLAVGDYRIEIIRDGYNLLADTISVSDHNDSIAFVLIGKASVSGHVVNSQTGEGLAGANIVFARDASSGRIQEVSSAQEIIVLTDANGNFNVEGAPTGNFNIVIEKEGFFPITLENTLLNPGGNSLSELIAVDIPEPGEIRIVLSWGDKPRDLDSHLTGPDDSLGRFHMYWDNKDPNSFVSLDVDDTTSYGPETTTIYSLLPGTYKYSVNDYAHGLFDPESGILISLSPTLVEVYDSTGLLHSFVASPFNGIATSWRVFEIVVTNTTYTIEPKNTYFTSGPGFSNSDNFRVGTGSKKAKYNMNDF